MMLRVVVSGATYVNSLAGEVADVPAEEVTVISTNPAEPAGDIALIIASLVTVNEVAGVPLKLTAVAPVKPVPVMNTVSPPAVEPDDGEMRVIDGPEAGLNPGWLTLARCSPELIYLTGDGVICAVGTPGLGTNVSVPTTW